MLDPDVYFEDTLEKQKLRSNVKCPRQQPNYHKLNTERMIVPITLCVKVKENLVIRDRFDWDLSKQYRSPYSFAKGLRSALSLSESEESEICNSILEQLIDHIERYTIQTRTRIPKKLEENAANNLTCLQCNSILYSNDICRACGVSLEKLRQKYGNISGLTQENKTVEEEAHSQRQTERQRTLESSRRRQEPFIGTSKKLCKKCGEYNHIMSIECRQCAKPISSNNKKPKNINETLAYHFWKILNRDSQFAQMMFLNDSLKEEHFFSVNRLYNKLKTVISEAETNFSLTPAKASEIMINLNYTYDRILIGCTIDQITNPTQVPKPDNEIKELDLTSIHLTTTSVESNPFVSPNLAVIDYRQKMYRPENQCRRRGRPRKYPLPEPVSKEANEIYEEEGEAKYKDEKDQSMNECGVCGDPGQLICCEACPSVYHLGCLNLKATPKGKWMCFFCRVVRDGLENALVEENTITASMNELRQPMQGIKAQALQILNILLMNPCSQNLVPDNLEMSPSDLNMIKDLVQEGHYKELEDVDAHIRQIFKAVSKLYKKKNQTLYSQVFNLQLYYNKILSELQASAGLQINTQPINIPNYKDTNKKIKYE
jgi:SNF5 / SMARCB1 / INI1/PHD-finger